MQNKNNSKKIQKRQLLLQELQSVIGVSFNDINLLNKVFIHPSYVGENCLTHIDSNQRLEFLGDAVLYVITAKFLYNSCPEDDEGKLSKKRIEIINGTALYKMAKYYNLGKYLLLGKGAIKMGITNNEGTLSDLFEALLGAMYIDRGFAETEKFLLDTIKKTKL